MSWCPPKPGRREDWGVLQPHRLRPQHRQTRFLASSSKVNKKIAAVIDRQYWWAMFREVMVDRLELV